jgi:hypothetical protein
MRGSHHIIKKHKKHDKQNEKFRFTLLDAALRLSLFCLSSVTLPLLGIAARSSGIRLIIESLQVARGEKRRIFKMVEIIFFIVQFSSLLFQPFVVSKEQEKAALCTVHLKVITF